MVIFKVGINIRPAEQGVGGRVCIILVSLNHRYYNAKWWREL